jgi:hypothetical protein
MEEWRNFEWFGHDKEGSKGIRYRDDEITVEISGCSSEKEFTWGDSMINNT